MIIKLIPMLLLLFIFLSYISKNSSKSKEFVPKETMKFYCNTNRNGGNSHVTPISDSEYIVNKVVNGQIERQEYIEGMEELAQYERDVAKRDQKYNIQSKIERLDLNQKTNMINDLSEENIDDKFYDLKESFGEVLDPDIFIPDFDVILTEED